MKAKKNIATRCLALFSAGMIVMTSVYPHMVVRAAENEEVAENTNFTANAENPIDVVVVTVPEPAPPAESVPEVTAPVESDVISRAN